MTTSAFPEPIKFGNLFKKRRIELNLSLKEVETATSIRSNMLSAIEEGNFAQLISPVYATGFISQYAKYLGIQEEPVIQQLCHSLQKRCEQHFSYGIGTLEVRSHPSRSLKMIPNAIWIGISFLLLVFAWFMIKVFGLF